MAGLDGGPGGVRGDVEVRVLGEDEGIVRSGWLGGEDVESGACDGAVCEGFGEVGFMDEGATASVDEEGGGLHLG